MVAAVAVLVKTLIADLLAQLPLTVAYSVAFLWTSVIWLRVHMKRKGKPFDTIIEVSRRFKTAYEPKIRTRTHRIESSCIENRKTLKLSQTQL